MRIAVAGSGNGALATAFEWAQNGHEVSLVALPDHHRNIPEIAEAGGITSEGELTGFAPIAYSGTDPGPALEGAEVVFVVGPSFSTEPLARHLAPHLRRGMHVIVCPTSTVGALTFKRAAGLDVTDDSIIVSDTSTLPYAVRADGQGSIRVFHRVTRGFYAASLPRQATDEVVAILREVYPHTEAASSIWQTTLQNGNPVIHPAVMLLNAGRVDHEADFFFYEEGVTDSVGRLIEAVDRERLALAEAMGVEILAEPDLGVLQEYMTEANYSTGYSQAPGFLGINAPQTLDNRYLTEDVGYGHIFLTDLARTLGVATPVMDAMITLAGVVLGRDFRAEQARTLASLGLEGLSVEELRAL